MQDADRGSCEETRKGYIKESNMKILNMVIGLTGVIFILLEGISLKMIYKLPTNI